MKLKKLKKKVLARMLFTEAFFNLFLFGILTLFIASCASTEAIVGGDVGGKATEIELGGGFHALIGAPLPSENTSIYGYGSFHMYSFEGGHDNLLQLGVQSRHLLNTDSKRLWVGGLAGWVQDKSIYKENDYSSDPKASGFTVGALAGYKIPLKTLDLNAYSGLSLISFGEFKSGDIVVDPKHTSFQFRVGVEIKLPFSK